VYPACFRSGKSAPNERTLGHLECTTVERNDCIQADFRIIVWIAARVCLLHFFWSCFLLLLAALSCRAPGKPHKRNSTCANSKTKAGTGKGDSAPEGDARSIAAIGGQLWQQQLLSLMTSVNKWPVSLVCRCL